jgi:hypothetical protein
VTETDHFSAKTSRRFLIGPSVFSTDTRTNINRLPNALPNRKGTSKTLERTNPPNAAAQGVPRQCVYLSHTPRGRGPAFRGVLPSGLGSATRSVMKIQRLEFF